MPDHSFAERFKRLEPVDLITIINTPQDYQPEAVAAAQTELTARQLTENQVAEARAIYDERIRATQAKKENWQQIKEKAQTVAGEISPVQFGAQSTDRYIRSVTIFAGVYFLYMVYRQYSFWAYSSSGDFPSLWLLYQLLPLTWLLIGGILFGLRKKNGWTLMAAYFCWAAMGSVIGIFFIGLADSAKSVVTVLVFGAAFYAIMNKEVREIYMVERKTVIIALVIGSIVAIGPWLSFMRFFF